MVVLLLLVLLLLGTVSAAPVLSFQKGHVAGAELPAGVNLDRASTVRKVHSTVFTVPSCVLVNVECMCEVAVYLLLKATFPADRLDVLCIIACNMSLHSPTMFCHFLGAEQYVCTHFAILQS